MATSRGAGVEVTIYPTLDPEGAAGAALTRALVDGLADMQSDPSGGS